MMAGGTGALFRWSHVVAWEERAGEWQPIADAGFDHSKFAVYVWRSVRTDGDTKTGEVTPHPGDP